MTYVHAYRLAQASKEQVTEMKNSVIERRDSKLGRVPARVEFADEIQEMSRILMASGVVCTTQRDAGSPFRLDTTTSAVVGSWGRASNEEYTTEVSEMRAVENMDSGQILSHFLRNDLPSKKTRLCLTGMIHGLLAVAAKNGGLYPLLVDLVSSYERELGTTGQDFDESRGSVDIGPSIEVARKKMTHILDNYTTLFLDGQEVFKEFLKHILDHGDYTAHELNDSEMKEIDPKFESIRDEQGTGSYAHVLLLRSQDTGVTILVYAVWQMASHIGSPQNVNRVGNSYIRTFDVLASSFERIARAKEENTIFGPITSFGESPLRRILVKDEAPQYLEKIREILNDDEIIAPTPNQVAGFRSHATDEGCEKGVHLMDNGEMSMSTLDRVTQAGVASHATDEVCEKGEHLMKNGELSMSTLERGTQGGVASADTIDGEARGVHLKCKGEGAGVTLTKSMADRGTQGGTASAGIPKRGGNESRIVVLRDEDTGKIYYSTTDAPMCEKMTQLKVFGSAATAKSNILRLKEYAGGGEFKLCAATKGGHKGKSPRGACGREMPANLNLWLSVASKVPIGDNVTKLGKQVKRKRAEHEGK